MISCMEFISKAEQLKPTVIKEKKKQVKLSGLQVLGLIILSFFTFSCLVLIAARIDLIAIIIMVLVLTAGWFGFFASIHYIKNERREEYQVKYLTLKKDILVCLGLGGLWVVAIIPPSCWSGTTNHFINSLLSIITTLSVLGVTTIYGIKYFSGEKRTNLYEKSKLSAPLFRLLNLLNIKQEEHKPYFLFLDSFGEDIRFGAGDLSIKIAQLEGKIDPSLKEEDFDPFVDKQGNNRHKLKQIDLVSGFCFDIPMKNWDTQTIERIKENLAQFVLSKTGKDLFCHPSKIVEIKTQIQDRHLMVYVITFRGNTFTLPNLYVGRYFFYAREDLPEIYKDVKLLYDILNF